MESQKPESTVERQLLSLASSLQGQSLSVTAAGSVATIRRALEAFVNSARYCVLHVWSQMVQGWQNWSGFGRIKESSF